MSEALRKKLSKLIFKDTLDYKEIESRYPKRELKEGAKVTRFAPSPTGFMHMGGIYAAMVSMLSAKKSGGTFFLRIEDTDQEREIEGGISEIIKSLHTYGITFDEGPTLEMEEKGIYGPYVQSERKEIYQAFAKKLLEEGLAYPCFATKEENDQIREKQKRAKQRTGIYGKWSKYREMPIEMQIEEIEKGTPFVIRFKSQGDFDRKIIVKDLIKGKLEMPQNDQDAVIIKGDGLPTYHFAHAVDEHLMGVNLVTRGDEWLSSLPLHIDLMISLGFKPPKYAHIAPLLKIDEETSNKRKLSKRKDPEANASYPVNEGIPIGAMKDYLMNIANSNYEVWRKQNPKSDILDFDFKLNKMGISGALFDMTKMLDVSKNYIALMSSEEIYESAFNWSKDNDSELYEMLKDKDKSIKILGIERDGRKKPRKDLAKWSEIKEANYYMFNDKFDLMEMPDKITSMSKEQKEEIKEIISYYVDNLYNESDSKDEWFDKIKDLSEKFGYCREVKEYKNDPEKYKGHVGDVSGFLRVIFTKRVNTPDLYEILNVLGLEEIKRRAKAFN